MWRFRDYRCYKKLLNSVGNARAIQSWKLHVTQCPFLGLVTFALIDTLIAPNDFVLKVHFYCLVLLRNCVRDFEPVELASLL